MAGVAVGFFTPKALVRDVDEFCRRVKTLLPLSSRAFPLAVQQLQDETNLSPMSLAVLSGALPLHIDKPNKNEREGGIFQLIMEAENRPCLVSAVASRDTSAAILDMEQKGVFALGGLELRAGQVVHFDITRHWHGVMGLPTGDPVPEEPSAVILQVPWPNAREIQRAIAIAMAALRQDERFKDLVR